MPYFDDILTLRDTAIAHGYTEAGWRYLVAVEMNLVVDQYIMHWEVKRLREWAEDAEAAKIINRKAAGFPPPEMPTMEDLL